MLKLLVLSHLLHETSASLVWGLLGLFELKFEHVQGIFSENSERIRKCGNQVILIRED